MYLVKLMFKFTQGSKGFDPGAEGGLGGRGGSGDTRPFIAMAVSTVFRVASQQSCKVNQYC